MKWTNPGHQLDSLGEQYLKVTNLYIYGTDERAKKAYDFLCWLGVANEFRISFVLDITVLNREECREFCGKRIIAFQTDLCQEVQTAPELAAVALPWIAQTAEREILEGLGLSNIFYLLHSHNRSDNFIQNFICIWLMYKHKKLLSHWTSYLVTSKCNLNCKCCLNFTEYLGKTSDVNFEDFRENIDAIFSKFDYLYSLHLCGGDPLMARELPKMIRYIEDHYKNRIFDFFLITNGTLIPSDHVVSAVKSLNGHFLIDDYSATISNTKLEEIKKKLEDNHIEYTINKVDSWFDLDIEHTDYSDFSEEELEHHKDNCQRFLHDIGEKCIYACCYQQYAHRAGRAELEEGDYIEIAGASKMEILEFRQGYTKRGYVSFCKTCKGIGDGAKLVPAAVQIPKRNTMEKMMESSAIVCKEEGSLVSICVPIYNTGKYLERCINSLLRQSYKNLEIVLVDDGSTDGSGLICDEYAAMDKRVTIVHKPNGGEASARNAALRSTKGEFVMFIDSDDEYLPNAVQQMVDAIQGKDIDLVIGGYIEKRGEVEHFAIGHQRIYSSPELARSYLSLECSYGVPYLATTVNAKLFRKKLIQENGLSFDERFVIGNDAVFMCNYLKCVKNIYNIFAPIYVYYKFQPTERIQGMNWYYPDAFFLFAYVADRMIKIVNPDEDERKHLIVKQYKDLLYALVNATANTQYFENGLLPYLTSFCDEIDLLQAAARLDLFEGYIQKEDGALPIRLISYLIVSRRYKDLYQLFQVFVKVRRVEPYKGEYIRQMIRMAPESDLKNEKTDFTAGQVTVPVLTDFMDDSLLANQINELVTTVMAGQQKIEALEKAVQEANMRFDQLAQESKARLEQIINSHSWRITKPLRASMDFLRRLRK